MHFQHTQGNNIANQAELAKGPCSSSYMSATCCHVDQDWYVIGDGQEDHPRVAESVEGGRGAKVDQAEQNLEDGVEKHGVQWNIELRMDPFPQAGRRKSPVAGERVNA